ncbi:hypothetical protein QYE76_038670 [Lolium multiflorum]|uniref:Transposase (putative) gypsy type domain-containing protein n=1 Tax=Lolium multiflorum TaxID=4521 RepID=A0AAD8WR49_LOLMU|nr:hypothetical protein QYE76_038670 [Lolium multiflorum]
MAPPPPALRLALAESWIADAPSLRKARHTGATMTNEWGATRMWMATARVSDLPDTAYPLLLHCITAGLVSVLHLHPNSITIHAIFAFWCEAFVGISPSIAFFRSYYSLHLTDPRESSGCLSFIPVPGQVFVLMSLSQPLPHFRGGWLFVDVRERSPHYDVPAALPARGRNWESVPFSSDGMEALEERISDLEALGLTGKMVVAEFLRQHVAPLQHNSAGMGALNSSRASLRLELAWLPPDAVAAAVGLLLGARQVPPLPPMATPLYDVPEAADTLGRMPHFDRWGPCPRATVRENPCTFRMFGEEVSELEDEGASPGLIRRRVKASTPPSFEPPTAPADPTHSSLGEASHRPGSEKKKRKKRSKSSSAKARKRSKRGSGGEQHPASGSPTLGPAPAPVAERLPDPALSPQPAARAEGAGERPAEASRAASSSSLEEACKEERVLGEDPSRGLQLVPSSGARQAPPDGSRRAPTPVGEKRAAPPGAAPGAIVALLPGAAPGDLVGQIAARVDALIQEADRLFEEMS